VSSISAPVTGITFAQIARAPAAPAPLNGEDQARADLYALLSSLLMTPPDVGLLDAIASSEPILAQGEDLALEQSWEQLTMASSVMDPQAVADEFTLLFESIGNPLINPYGSRYLSGFINDTPLAELRADMARLGLARLRGASEFEDHIGALCETMRVLITGAPGIARQPLAQQHLFFNAHIAPWYARVVDDIAGAEGANYYRLVARLAGAFLAVEAQAFAVGEDTDETY
jgi:TorA maturation chaperone TorD